MYRSIRLPTSDFHTFLKSKANSFPPLVQLQQRFGVSSCRFYATQDSLPSTTPAPSPRRRVTVANDDGRVRWGDLSKREKVARTTQQSFNFSIIIVGVVMTVGDFTLELLFTNADTRRGSGYKSIIY